MQQTEEVVDVIPNLDQVPIWTSVAFEFDPTQFSILGAFERALRELVGNAIHQLRPDLTVNAAIIMPVACGFAAGRRAGYAYRWYRIGEVPATGRELSRHMRFPILFDETVDFERDPVQGIRGRRPFFFDQPVTLAAAYLHHEIQRRPHAATLLNEIKVRTSGQRERICEYWKNLDEDKRNSEGKYCVIRTPGDRYPELHTETFAQGEAAKGTVATFVQLLVVRNTLLGLFCVDIAEAMREGAASSGGSLNPLDQFTSGLVSLGVGIEATLDACAKAYYTHLDRPRYAEVSPSGPKKQAMEEEEEGEVPILSAAFLEALVTEVDVTRCQALETCPMAYLFFDNNDLKKINTVGNYECGTEVIRATGQWICKGLAKWVDTHFKVTYGGRLRERLDQFPQSWVVRWGGDEFVAIVAGGKGGPADSQGLLTSIGDVIAAEREKLAIRILSLVTVKAKNSKDRKELGRIIAATSVSVGGVFVPRVDGSRGGRFDGTLPVFLREARLIAEDRMKLVKEMGKLDYRLRMMVERGLSSELTVEAQKGGLRWCYGGLAKDWEMSTF